MQWLRDSKTCLRLATLQYQQVEELMKEDLNEDELDLVKGLIKNILENCRSPLDYVANYTFETYCRGRKPKLNFPISRSNKDFVRYTSTTYFGLNKSKKSLYDLLESKQPYNPGFEWLVTLTLLVNHNKHQNLSKQVMNTSVTNASFRIPGMTFNNCSFKGNGALVSYNDAIKISLKELSTHSLVRNFNGKIEFIYIFNDIKEPVLPTLKKIINGVESIIEDIANLVNQ